jgi:hypothetical protein
MRDALHQPDHAIVRVVPAKQLIDKSLKVG